MIIRRLLKNKRGAVALIATISIAALVGLAAISVDAGYAYSMRGRLQASAEAAALAGAKDIGVGGTPITTATAYASTLGAKNVIPGITATMAAGSPALVCFSGAATSGLSCSTNQTPATSANGITVTETATVPLFFARILGFPSVTMTASAVALAGGQTLPPLNVAFIVDTTQSMNSSDSSCGKTRIACAISGFQTLLGELWPCKYNTTCTGANPVDEAMVLQFPPLQTAPTAGACGSLTTTAYAGISAKTTKSTAKGGTALTFSSTPAFTLGAAGTSSALLSGWPYVGQVSDENSASSFAAGTYLSAKTTTTATLSLGTTGAGVAKGDTIAVWPPIYQVIGLSADYRTSDTATTLNASSNLVKCLNSLSAVGGYGTYYADAISAAQQVLAANARTGARNVIILLSDGQATAAASTMVSQGPTLTLATNECKAAVTAAQAAASAGTWVYAVAYGTPSSGGCTTDTGSYASACYAMSQIANLPGSGGTYTNDPTKFYSDDSAGCASTAHAKMTLATVFQNIAYSLTAPRLLPSACLAAKPPGYC